MSGLSLFTIEDSLQLLMEAREDALIDGDEAAVAECDKALAQYLTAEAAKVDSYAALIRRTQFEAECCASEEARLAARRKQCEALTEKLKANALAVMQRFDVKELKSPTSKLRRQTNGGVQPLEMPGPMFIPPEYLDCVVRLSLNLWKRLAGELSEVESREVKGATYLPDAEALRKALMEQVPCPECKGSDTAQLCERCQGKGIIPRTISGAKLLPRGEHVRVS